MKKLTLEDGWLRPGCEEHMFAAGAKNTVRIARKVVDYTAKRLEVSEVNQCSRRALRLSHPVYELGSPIAIAVSLWDNGGHRTSPACGHAPMRARANHPDRLEAVALGHVSARDETSTPGVPPARVKLLGCTLR